MNELIYYVTHLLLRDGRGCAPPFPSVSMGLCHLVLEPDSDPRRHRLQSDSAKTNSMELMK